MNEAILIRAAAFAAHKHSNQRRKDDEASPYINHPIAVANLLANEAGIHDVTVLCAALLHDTIEDTDTTAAELEAVFDKCIASIVAEVTDDNTLPKTKRKQLQIEHGPRLSREAKLVKLADKTCNLRDILDHPPVGWTTHRKAAYFTWAAAVVQGMRGTHNGLESLFDAELARRPGTLASFVLDIEARCVP